MADKRVFLITMLIMAFASMGETRNLLDNCATTPGQLTCAADCFPSFSLSPGCAYECRCGSAYVPQFTTPSSSPRIGRCFPGSSLVTTPAGPKQMNQLALGDSVLTVSNSGAVEFNKVYMFTSHRPQEIATFVHLTTSAGANITLTPDHYIFSMDSKSFGASKLSPAASVNLKQWKYSTATEIAVGDYVLVDTSTDKVAPARVLSSTAVLERGVFNPHTRTGAIVVDGVVASELTAFIPKWVATTEFERHIAKFFGIVFQYLPEYVDGHLARLFAKIAKHGVNDVSISRAALFGSAK